jgi:uncharacterized damage-inducible protein DinB
MNKLLVTAFVWLICCAPAFGQATKKDLLATWEQTAELALGVADAMPAEKYDFRATPEVRSFGEQVKHVAGVYANLLSWVRGVPAPKNGNDAFMRLKTKDEIMAALRQTVQENTAALKSMPSQKLAGQINTEFFGRVSRSFVVLMVIGHTNRHYGQMVVYLRLNGVVPPISRDQ